MTYKAMQLVSVTAAILLYLSALGYAQNPTIAPVVTPTLPVSANNGTATNGTAVSPPPAVTPPANLTLPSITKVDVIETMPRAKVCSPDSSVCMTVTDLGDGAFNVMAEFPEVAKWGAVGWGTVMPQSDIILGYKNNATKQFIVSDRKALLGKAPAPVDQQQDALAIRGGGGLMPGKWIMEFQRKKDTGDRNDSVVDLSKKVSMIWAYHATTSPTIPTSGDNADFRATITKHTNTGKLTLDMQDEAQVKAAKESGLTGEEGSSATARSNSNAVVLLPKALPTLGTVLVMLAVMILA